MPLVPHISLGTQYIYAPAPTAKFGDTIAIVGEAASGDDFAPFFATGISAVKKVFTSGPLVDTCEAASVAGCKSFYLVKTPDTEISHFMSAIEVLIDYPIHIILPAGLIYNGNIHDFALLADKCATTFKGNTLVMSECRFPQEEELDSWITSLFKDSQLRNGVGPNGHLLSIVAGDAMLNFGAGSRRLSPLAPVYAGLLTTLTSYTSPVNKPVDVIDYLPTTFLGDVTRTETIIPTLEETVLERRPMSRVYAVDNSTSEALTEDLDFRVNYLEGTISITPVGIEKLQGSNIKISYEYNNYDTLAVLGFVTFYKFPSGFAPICDTTMGREYLRKVSDVRLVQNIGWHVTEIGNSLIGSSIVELTTFENSIISMLNKLVLEGAILSNYTLYIAWDDTEHSVINVEIGVTSPGSLAAIDVIVRVPTGA